MAHQVSKEAKHREILVKEVRFCFLCSKTRRCFLNAALRVSVGLLPVKLGYREIRKGSPISLKFTPAPLLPHESSSLPAQHLLKYLDTRVR